jgi:hypothetical protein
MGEEKLDHLIETLSDTCISLERGNSELRSDKKAAQRAKKDPRRFQGENIILLTDSYKTSHYLQYVHPYSPTRRTPHGAIVDAHRSSRSPTRLRAPC